MIGKYAAKMDDKNRLFVPAKLRNEMGDDFFVTLGVNCGHRCLTVYTAEEWQRLSDNFNALSLAQRSGATSLIFMNANECSPDKQFRFTLSQFLLDYAGRPGQSIADPWYTGNFGVTYEDILEGCEGLLKYLLKSPIFKRLSCT